MRTRKDAMNYDLARTNIYTAAPQSSRRFGIELRILTIPRSPAPFQKNQIQTDEISRSSSRVEAAWPVPRPRGPGGAAVRASAQRGRETALQPGGARGLPKRRHPVAELGGVRLRSSEAEERGRRGGVGVRSRRRGEPATRSTGVCPGALRRGEICHCASSSGGLRWNTIEAEGFASLPL